MKERKKDSVAVSVTKVSSFIKYSFLLQQSYSLYNVTDILILYRLIVKLNAGLCEANVTIDIEGRCRHKGTVMVQPLYLITSIYTCDAMGISNPP